MSWQPITAPKPVTTKIQRLSAEVLRECEELRRKSKRLADQAEADLKADRHNEARRSRHQDRFTSRNIHE